MTPNISTLQLPYTWIQYRTYEVTSASTSLGITSRGKAGLACAKPTKVPKHRWDTSFKCKCHDRFWSIITLNFFQCEEGFKGTSTNRITGITSIRDSCFRSPQTIISVFDALTFIPCWRNQVTNLSNTVSKHFDMSARRFRGPVTASWVSSAYLTVMILKPSISLGIWQEI